jgi:hypothetical protein
LVLNCAAGHYFEFLIHHHLEVNVFLFLVSMAKLIGNFYNNRQSVANRCLRFAYSSFSLMLR